MYNPVDEDPKYSGPKKHLKVLKCINLYNINCHLQKNDARPLLGANLTELFLQLLQTKWPHVDFKQTYEVSFLQVHTNGIVIYAWWQFLAAVLFLTPLKCISTHCSLQESCASCLEPVILINCSKQLLTVQIFHSKNTFACICNHNHLSWGQR